MKKLIALTCCLLMLVTLTGCAAATRHANDRDASRLGLIWQPTFDKDTPDLTRQKSPLPGINVVSPCWFVFTADGHVNAQEKVKPHKDYVNRLHKLGYRVWALVSNDFDPELTAALLASADARRRAAQQLLRLCDRYKLDGINLDLENVNVADRDRLTAFVAELSAALHEKQRTVSIDVTFPGGSGNWSLCYDRRALAQHVDYLALMAYDEHPRSSPTAGSVASLTWVERGLLRTLAEVPPQKLLLGMPLYTRRWGEVNGKVSKVATLDMAEATALWRDRGLSRQWLPKEGQHYYEYPDGDLRQRVWQEDARSLALKAALVSRYDLAGFALWRLGFETPDIYDALAR